jgi:hypothetical protein
MLSKELFDLLVISDIDLNGDIELTRIGILWKYFEEIPMVIENDENYNLQENLIEAFEEDFDIIKNIYDEFDENLNEIDIDEIYVMDNFIYVDLIFINE